MQKIVKMCHFYHQYNMTNSPAYLPNSGSEVKKSEVLENLFPMPYKEKQTQICQLISRWHQFETCTEAHIRATDNPLCLILWRATSCKVWKRWFQKYAELTTRVETVGVRSFKYLAFNTFNSHWKLKAVSNLQDQALESRRELTAALIHKGF